MKTDRQETVNGQKFCPQCVAIAEQHFELLARAEAAESECKDAARYRWWREHSDILSEDEAGIVGVAFSCQIPVINFRDPNGPPPFTSAQLFDMVADGYIAGAKEQTDAAMQAEGETK